MNMITPVSALPSLVDRFHPEQVAFLAELVKVPSDNPPGDCRPHAEAAARLLEALGFTPDSFTCVFALGRTTGWLAHAKEQIAGGRLIRPQSVYVGPQPRQAA